MSNRLTIEPTEFKDLRSGEITYGYKASDDYASVCGELPERPSDDNLEFLAQVVQANELYTNETLTDMLDFLHENGKGAYIGDEWYDWEQLKTVILIDKTGEEPHSS